MNENQSNPLVLMEHRVLSFWEEHDVFSLSLKKNKGNKRYVFYDGPPFATGLPHHGHLLASTIKDVIPRYQTMKGYDVPRRFGWDCHGLPIEHEINKSMGLHAHEAVASLGIAGYNAACRAIVMRYREEWRQVIRRIGRWVDMDHDYKTMDASFMESVWWGFAQLWQKDLIYLGNKIVPYSPTLETVLSNFEASSNYQDTQDPSLTIRVSLSHPLGGLPTDVLIWTTTPWTLPANGALCVHPDANYVGLSVEGDNRQILIAEARVDAVMKDRRYTLNCRVQGQELLHASYEPIYARLFDDPGAYQIFTDAFVSLESGTGIVHMAPAFGEDDQRVCARYGLDRVCDPLDSRGYFTERCPELFGRSFKEADTLIIRTLKEKGSLFEHQTLVHSYPFCPRSDTPLMYRAIPSWYVRVERLKDTMLRINQSIHWVPKHIQEGRFGQWLAHAKDWAISRNRVWGTPLPLWINSVTGKILCMDSRAMLEQYTGVWLEDLHREHVDGLSFSIDGEPGVYERVPEVLDCWFESGSMPWAQHGYPFSTPQQSLSDYMPADFIAEGLDQTRGWFYTLTVLAAAMTEAPAFTHVIVNGIVSAEDGKKMSKRLKNYTTPMELMERYGADALRLYMIHSGLVKGEEQRFSDLGVEHMARHTLMPWLNAVKFFEGYADAESWRYPEVAPPIEHVLDRWILSRCSSLIESIEGAMSQYQLYQVVPPLLYFIEEMTNTYIRMNRSRFWGTAHPSDPAAFYTLYTVLYQWTVCMAPFAPLTAEAMYQKLKAFRSEDALSVHLKDYPQPQITAIDKDTEEAVSWMQRIITLGRHQRNLVHIPIKTPLPSMTIVHKDPSVLAMISSLKELLLTELNVYDLTLETDETRYVDFKIKPNSRVLGKRLGAQFKAIFQRMMTLPTAAIQEAETTGYIEIEGIRIESDAWSLERIARHKQVATDGSITLVLDTALDARCLAQGRAREWVSLIQRYRKTRDLNLTDRIHLAVALSPQDREVLEAHRTYVMEETLCIQLDVHSQDAQSDDYERLSEDLSLQLRAVIPSDPCV